MSKGLTRLLSDSEDSTHQNPPLRVAEMHDEDAVQIFKALSGESTCRIYTAIQESPRTASELQQEIGTSIQNVHYHLNKLEEADLIESVGTRYSEKGTEMTVFGPTHGPLVISFAAEPASTNIRNALTRLFGAVAVLGVLSVSVEMVLTQAVSTVSPAGSPQNVSVTAPQFAQPTPTETLLTSPAILVFIAGLLLISVYVTWRYAARP